jgi:hypothetical protein
MAKPTSEPETNKNKTIENSLKRWKKPEKKA